MGIGDYILTVSDDKMYDITDQHKKQSHKDICNLKDLSIGVLFLSSRASFCFWRGRFLWYLRFRFLSAFE